ncbi:EscU/YscU/HrcU family type III secretion system export apparatus switch protein [Salipiger mucosus]|uniref:Flagellar biosynthesis protein FlhB n=1 Tax=Salipiger mucosus DSM 16094 TaxID=1123237 RepID=S9RVJ9_9RHOB|nr:flagellar type III secretion system protein FlhB [Salipiger mucosus]EPX78004.1 Flagellar biosynthesis protein FlhB [Salipiger mucosus DSM 16094]
MSDEDKSQKTEEPTPKKLNDQRKKGNVPSSKETGNAMSIFILMIIVVYSIPAGIGPLRDALAGVFDIAGTAEIGTRQQGVADIGKVFGSLMDKVIAIIGPIFVLMAFAAIFGTIVQGETVVAVERLKPKASNISPASGLKKIFGADNFVEFLKSLLKVGTIATIAYLIISDAIMSIAQTRGFVPEVVLAFAGDRIALMLVIVSALLAPVAVADIIWKRQQWIKKNKMSMKEIRDEHKDMEGDPHMKSKRDEKRREMSKKRMKEAVPTATVVLTNPTHYAVALKYDMATDPVPTCVFKGTDIMAGKIRELAREHEIPIVENRPLARSLYASVDIDGEVPADHWQAVAEIVAYVMDLKKNIRRRPPEGSELCDG